MIQEPTQGTVLYVGSDDNNQRVTQRLAEGGLTVETVRRPEQALTRVEETAIDCLVSEYDLPTRDGVALLEDVRDQFGGLPFVLFTDSGSEAVASDAIANDVTAYIRRDATENPYVRLRERIQEIVEDHPRVAWTEHSISQFWGAVIESANVWITVLDRDGAVTAWNRAAAEISGYPAAEVVGSDDIWRRLYPDEEYRAEIREQNSAIINGEPVEEFETTIQTSEGTERIISWHAHPITDRDGALAGSVAVGRDVTDREQMKQRFQTLIDNLPGVVYRCRNEPGWPMEFVGGDCESLTGYTAEQLESGDVQWEESLTHPDDKEKVRAEVAQALEAGEPFEVRYRIQTADGDQRWMWERGRKVPAPAGTESELLEGFVTEITERKQYERRLEEQRNNLKLLNKVLRHDIRNDLQVVTLYAELLESEIDDEQQEYITRLITNAEHATNLTETARVMADVMLERERDRENIDLKRVLESELDEARLRSDDAAIAVDGSLPSVTVRADEMLHSVFANLLKNAIQHNDKETPEVTVSLTEYSDSVVVEVADNGPGITAERKTAIFGEGEKGLDSEGTGIGLYLVRTLVEDYGGTIRVEDNAPTGAVFVVELPRGD